MASILPSWRSGSSQLDLRMGRPVYSASHAQARLHPLVPGAYLPRGPDSKQTPNIMSGNWGSPDMAPLKSHILFSCIISNWSPPETPVDRAGFWLSFGKP